MGTETGPLDAAPLVVIMGVSGSGKSTVGALLAAQLGVPFTDADALHPPENVAKMAAGEPLDDADRAPWLDAVGAELAAAPSGLVVGCSALKRAYRDRIRAAAPQSYFAHLAGSPDLIAERLAGRAGHFMPAGLLGSQLRTLEALGADERGGVIEPAEGQSPAELATIFAQQLRG